MNGFLMLMPPRRREPRDPGRAMEHLRQYHVRPVPPITRDARGEPAPPNFVPTPDRDTEIKEKRARAARLRGID